MLDPSTSATGATITPREISELPVNGRNYLDLLQLVPGVAINRQVDPNSDRVQSGAGRTERQQQFPDRRAVEQGHRQRRTGAAVHQETIAEFQVLTSGYKAEFGQASGAIVNVITKSGSNLFSGVGSLFWRDDALDTSNSLDETRTDPLPLRRYDSSVALGGPLVRDKVFFFGSAEHIGEDRQLDFKYPDTGNAVVNQLLREQEAPYDVPTRTSETRAFIKFDERVGQHQLTPAGELHRQLRSRASCRCRRQQPALGAKRYRHQPAAAGVRRHGAAGQSGQPVCRDAARGVPARGQRDASVTDGPDRIDALQSL